MLSRTFLSEEERRVDPQLGYPRGYAKLCRNAATQLQGLITPFTEGPPQRFMPYAPQLEEIARLKDLDSLFPVLKEAERDPPNARKYADFLWRQLDHLGNAGFDPAKFRVDMYGNVLYWNADAGSPLAWEIDHWFPHSRGGKTVMSNLRVLQWQTNQRKANKLEFLVPWWDLQLGVSVNQFLSAFASKNVEFRKRSFLLFFAGGEDEQAEGRNLVGSHAWPAQFRERKVDVGIAAAAIVSMSRRDHDDVVRTSWAIRASRDLRNDGSAVTGRDVSVPATGTPARRRWTVEEEEALRRAVQKFGPGSWKEIKENEPALASRSTVQIKDKYRLLRGDWHQDKENVTAKGGDKDASVAAAIQKETKLKQMREDEKKVKEEELAHLQETLSALTQENEAEFLALEDLEALLIKNKEKVEKQRRWAETQSSYRICLERMIRDTMHQSVNFKEQARLNQAACNALLVRLDCQKQTSVAAGTDLVKKYKQREELLALACPELPVDDHPLLLKGLDVKDNSLEEQVFAAKCLRDEPSDSGDTCIPSLPSVSESACDSGTSLSKVEEVQKPDTHIDRVIPEGDEKTKGVFRLQPLDTKRAKPSLRKSERDDLVEGMAKLKLTRDGSASRSHDSGHSSGPGKRSFDEERERPERLPREGSRTKKMKKLEAGNESGFRSDQGNSRKARTHVQELRRDKSSKSMAGGPAAGDSLAVFTEFENDTPKENQVKKHVKCSLAEEDDSGSRPWIELDRLPKCDKASRVTEWLDAVGPPRVSGQYRYGSEPTDNRHQRDSVVQNCTTSKQLLVDVEDAEGEDDGDGAELDVDVVVVGFEYADIDKGVVLERQSGASQKTESLETRSVVPTLEGVEISQIPTGPNSRRVFTAPMPRTDETEREEQKKVIVVESPGKPSEVAATKLDDILQEMLDTQLNRSSEQRGVEEVELEEDEKIRQLGKSNLDKWLHVLLHKEAVATLEDEDAGEGGEVHPSDQQGELQEQEDPLSRIRQDITSTVAKERADQESEGPKPAGLLVGLLKKLSFRQPLESRQSLRSSISPKVPEAASMEQEPSKDVPEDELKPSKDVPEDELKPSKDVPEDELKPATGLLHEDLSSLEDLSYAQTEGSMSPPPSKGVREDWDVSDQARSGLRASIKACTVAWRRAVKKMEPRPVTPSWALI